MCVSNRTRLPEHDVPRSWATSAPGCTTRRSRARTLTLLAAERTERIGLGPGVLVPSLRHPMVNAAATATLASLAPGRVAVAFGTGFTGRRAMGYGAIPWAFMDSYIRAFRGLLSGETVEWEGAKMRMLHPPGHAEPRPVEVPIIVGALGPKGAAVARELGDGLFRDPPAARVRDRVPRVSTCSGGRSWTRARRAQLRPCARGGWAGMALAYHGAYESREPAGGARAARSGSREGTAPEEPPGRDGPALRRPQRADQAASGERAASACSVR